jgi:tetratricopeptide (TPR) repeat protein
MGRYDEAIESYRQVIRIQPNDAEAYYNMGIACRGLGNINEAIESFKQAIRIKPSYIEAHYNLGVAYMEMGKRDSSLQEYEILKELDKDLADRLFRSICR